MKKALTVVVLLMMSGNVLAKDPSGQLEPPFPVQENGRWSLIDKTGRKIVELPSQIKFVCNFKEGLAAIKLDKENGVIDKSGRIIFRTPYDIQWTFNEGIARIFAENRKYGFIDKTGKVLLRPEYDEAWHFSEGMGAVCKGDRWGFVNREGKIAIPPQFMNRGGKGCDGYIGWHFSEGLCPVQVQKKTGFIDKTGKVVIAPQFDNFSWFSEGLASVRIGEKFGYIDTSGKMVIPAKFDEAGSFSDGLAKVGTKNDFFQRILHWERMKREFIDKNGNPHPAPNVEPTLAFTLTDDRKIGVLDPLGKIIIPPSLDVYPSPVGDFWQVIEPDMKIGYLDKAGNWIWKPTK